MLVLVRGGRGMGCGREVVKTKIVSLLRRRNLRMRGLVLVNHSSTLNAKANNKLRTSRLNANNKLRTSGLNSTWR